MKKELSFLVCLIALAFVFCICESVFAAGGTGNVKQLGKKVYVWSFNEGQGKEAKDSTAGLVGNLVGDIKWGKGVSGKAGDFALQFSGKVGAAQYVEVPHSKEVDIDEAITMAAWVYPHRRQAKK